MFLPDAERARWRAATFMVAGDESAAPTMSSSVKPRVLRMVGIVTS